MKILSLFSGAGGLDLGFKQAGFECVWANEYDKTIWQTYEHNHSDTHLEKTSIVDIKNFPDCDGIIGGPPCQSWSVAGSSRGIQDPRGKLFFEFIRVLNNRKPLFFLAENVPGILNHKVAFNAIKSIFQESGYALSVSTLNASDYGVPQDRKRVFFIGINKKLNKEFIFPEKEGKSTLKEALEGLPVPVGTTNESTGSNNEYMLGGFSSIYMSRNRVRDWDDVSFTIQATARHIPIHPSADKMVFVSKDKWVFSGDVRRLSVRECARIQTFPDDFSFVYDKIVNGYKMVGNAVPVLLAKILATQIKKTLINNE